MTIHVQIKTRGIENGIVMRYGGVNLWHRIKGTVSPWGLEVLLRIDHLGAVSSCLFPTCNSPNLIMFILLAEVTASIVILTNVATTNIHLGIFSTPAALVVTQCSAFKGTVSPYSMELLLSHLFPPCSSSKLIVYIS